MDILQQADPEVFAAIAGERKRQQVGLEMIASENYTSTAVMAAQGSCLTNKYAEGYPGKRYYGGCEFVDVAEKLAIDRVKQLFGAEHANVQPHSGAQANMAVFLAALYPGDTILGLDLAHGGHLTHGMRLNFSGKYFQVVSYGVRKEDQRIDFDDLVKKAREHKPRIIIAGASAYPRFFDFGKFAEISKEVGALLMVDMAHIAGLVAAKLHPDPVPHADFVTSTAHKTLRGPRSGFILCRKNTVQDAFLTDEDRSKKEPPTWDKRIDSAVFPGVQGGPLMHVVAAKAVAFGEALLPSFKTYAAQVIANAKVLAAELQSAGFSIVSGGTDNHLMLVDVTTKGVTGKQAEHALEAAGITVNKNMIPFDPRKPLDPSGIRIGTPALTTRGMKEAEMRQIAKWITDVLTHPADAGVTARVKGGVMELCKQHPAPAESARMNPFQLICGCFVLLMLIPVAMFLVTFIYRWSCSLCGLPKPTVLVAAGIMFIGWVSLVMAVGILELVVKEACAAAGVPRWESGIIVFLLALPLDLTVTSGIESGLMGVKFGKGVEVWYTQRLIQLSIISAIGFIAGIVILIRQLN